MQRPKKHKRLKSNKFLKGFYQFISFCLCSDARLIDELHQNNKNTEDDDDDGSDSGGDEDGDDVEVAELDLGDEG